MTFLQKTLLSLSAVLLVIAFSAEANAQRRGFFQRLRDDAKKRPATPPKKTGKTPTLAKPNQNAKTPTPAKPNAAQNQRRTPAQYRAPQPKQNAAQPNNNNRNNNRAPYRSVVQPNPATPVGFGWLLAQDKGDRLFVSRIDPRGNAAKAGVQQGDIVAEAGGVKISSKDDYEQITKIIEKGDQMDFKVISRGKEKEYSIQYGQSIESRESSPSSGADSVLELTANNQLKREIASLRNLVQQQRITITQLREQMHEMQFESKPSPPTIPAGSRSVIEGPIFNSPNR